MRKLTFLFISMIATAGLMAQEMPQPSPAASVMQRVGLTDITVDYSRPGVKGRTIFGDLVPYGELWRTGANAATKVTVSTDVMIGDQTLKAGSYSLFTIPTETEWTIIFNKNTDLWGTGGYTQREDALRMRLAPEEGAMTERFGISIENMTDNSADMVIAWDKTRVVIPIKVEVEKQSQANIDKALNDAWRAYRNAAEYYSKKGDYEKAVAYIDQSLAMNNNWYSNWIKAEILMAKGDKKDAKKQGKMAIEMGQAVYDERGQDFTYRAGLEKEMKEW